MQPKQLTLWSSNAKECINKIKPNKWVENYSINLNKVRQEQLSTFASSKIKGFM
jgi:hypothetical protein